MTKKKSSLKTVFIAIGVIAAIVIATICIGNIKSNKNNEPLSDIERISKMLTTTRKTDIFILGDEIDFNDNIKTTSIDKVSEAEIDGSGDYKVIILNDLNNNIKLSDDEICLLKDYISTNNYMLIYLGEKYSATFDDESQDGIANVENNLAYIYYSWDSIPTRNVGAWTKAEQEELTKYPGLLEEALLYSIETYLQ